MAHTQDYIPPRDANFDSWLTNLTDYVDEKVSAGAWTHIPADKVRALKQHRAEWHAAYVKMAGPHTPVDTRIKNDARKAATAFVRRFVAQYLRYDPVTNEDRIAMNLHNRDTTYTRIGTPTTRILIPGLRALGGVQVEIHFHDDATPTRRAIPYGCIGGLLHYTAGGEKTRDYDALTHTRLMTRSPFTLSLPPETEGKFLSCAARWQNERGDLGRWGEIRHIVIA